MPQAHNAFSSVRRRRSTLRRNWAVRRRRGSVWRALPYHRQADLHADGAGRLHQPAGLPNVTSGAGRPRAAPWGNQLEARIEQTSTIIAMQSPPRIWASASWRSVFERQPEGRVTPKCERGFWREPDHESRSDGGDECYRNGSSGCEVAPMSPRLTWGYRYSFIRVYRCGGTMDRTELAALASDPGRRSERRRRASVETQ